MYLKKKERKKRWDLWGFELGTFETRPLEYKNSIPPKWIWEKEVAQQTALKLI